MSFLCIVVNMSEPLSFTTQGLPDNVSTTSKLETTRHTTNINWTIYSCLYKFLAWRCVFSMFLSTEYWIKQ